MDWRIAILRRRRLRRRRNRSTILSIKFFQLNSAVDGPSRIPRPRYAISSISTTGVQFALLSHKKPSPYSRLSPSQLLGDHHRPVSSWSLHMTVVAVVPLHGPQPRTRHSSPDFLQPLPHLPILGRD
ncbi:hypothetical protein ARMGADRAFT_443548 [Armillaria gallica]|uniref:Uncharacterized protein n=1 Tax=Armillaria gallica TaxID=47427 RepID=A0A2H3DL10_ARMGA|nr:hypothetical protein ARMGADRAFT_443548 [Armillaria gallica]